MNRTTSYKLLTEPNALRIFSNHVINFNITRGCAFILPGLGSSSVIADPLQRQGLEPHFFFRLRMNFAM